METGNRNYNSGINGTTLLQTAFIVLKLCKVIDWSWWWVLSPIWIGIALVIVVFLVMLPFEFAKRQRESKALEERMRSKMEYAKHLEEMKKEK